MRQSRNAQNDVLTTVGICGRVDKDGNQLNSDTDDERQRELAIEPIMKENRYGLRLTYADWILFHLTNTWLLGLRQRLQVRRWMSLSSFAN